MLDIPMLQPTPKTDRGELPTSKEMKVRADKDGSEADFDKAYASESEDVAVLQGDVKPEPVLVEEEVIPTLEAAEADSELEANETEVADDLADPEIGVASEASTPEELKNRKSTPGAGEMAFSQQLSIGLASNVEIEDAPTGVVATKVVAGTEEPGQILTTDKSTSAPGEVSSKFVQVTTSIIPPMTQGATVGSGMEPPIVPILRASETISQSAVQLTASVSQNQQLQPTVSQMTLAPTVETAPDKRTKVSFEESTRFLTDANLRSEPRAAAVSQAPFTTTPVNAVQPLTQSTTQLDTSVLDGSLIASGEAEMPTPWEARSTSTPSSLAQTIARPETPGLIGRQMAEVLQRMPDRPVELALNPEELGRVRLSISAAEGGITVSVLAERPETLDLMRRHIDQLAREFQALGYKSINFAFSEGQSEQNPNQQEGSGSGNSVDHAAAMDASGEPVVPVRLSVSSGVDLRL